MPAKSPSKPRKTATKSGRSRTASSGAPRAAKPKLLSGGNPQIPKGEGDAPVQAFIEAMPEWKRDIGRRIDAIIVRTVPGVRKAVKWNTPFFGVGEEGYFTAFHCFDKYVKVTFFRGASLEPRPPGASRMKDVRYYDIHEGKFDEAQFTSWIRQAAALPGVVS
ncbi:DUF1801 domain-containing protein [Pyxidicoccus fallax]|uniref:DUF1801 domain-containing protein n=1 Tax=Pyxidicoccus fallax TaxID=394095 RepID=A0A848LAA4_9BACT|nr:DUF1801 domain-containing protein [Pyxidicoccus fallax]NMO15426.1 DUF1801 domain-containing protein [Pyxidicoccus fallax]NPC79121.1 DUF1801 domain-containing protein [Pyxidicoccus fallax]